MEKTSAGPPARVDQNFEWITAKEHMHLTSLATAQEQVTFDFASKKLA